MGRDEDGDVSLVKMRPVHDGFYIEAPAVAVQRRYGAQATVEGDSGAVNQLSVKQVEVLLRLKSSPYSVQKSAQLRITPCTDLFFKKDNSFEYMPKNTALVVRNSPLADGGVGGIYRFAHKEACLIHRSELIKIPHQKDNRNTAK